MPPSRAMHPAVQAAFFVERYAVYDEFAAGGMATVHFARLNGAHGFRRTVAVKRLLPHLTRDQDFALMLIDEARLASRVRHHNVVSTLDVVQTSEELLLVMEYVHGESLAKLVRWSVERNEPVPVAIAVAIVIDALHGLHAAHEAKDEQGVALGLVHRDVSPQNVLVGLDGITRIADFGVAKAAGRAQSTQDGAVKGKLAYMAPEQLGGGDVSRVSDVFAIAIVLWEVLTGERLFAGQNHAETVFKVMSAPIPRPSARRASLPPALDAIVLRGLERDPQRRYESAREMAIALEHSAPSVRPSEIASWVERVVGDRLTLRARTLSAIERDTESEVDAPTAVRELVVPAQPWHDVASTRAVPVRASEEGARAVPVRASEEGARAVALRASDESAGTGAEGVPAWQFRSPFAEPRVSTAEPSEVETGTHRKEPVSRSAPRELAASLPSDLGSTPAAHAEDLRPATLESAHRAGKKSATFRMLIGGGSMALLALLSVLAWTLLQRRAAPSATAPGEHAPRASETVVTHAVDQGGTLGAAQVAPVSALPASALPASALPALALPASAPSVDAAVLRSRAEDPGASTSAHEHDLPPPTGLPHRMTNVARVIGARVAIKPVIRRTRSIPQAGCCSKSSACKSESRVKSAFLLFALWSLCSASVALAAPPSDDAHACVAASTLGQTDRDEGRLLAAREQLLLCAREACPSIVKKSCGGWLKELDERIPSVVVRVHSSSLARGGTARFDEAGQRDLTDAQVVLDGRAVTLDGRPIALDPGRHVLSVEGEGGRSVLRTFLIAEREQGRLLIVELPAQSGAQRVEPAGSLPANEGSAHPQAEPRSPTDKPSVSTHDAAVSASQARSSRGPRHFRVPTGAWVLGGLGVAGIVTFAALRTKAKNDLDEADAEGGCSPDCPPSQSDAGYRKLLAADVSLGIGIAAFAGAGMWTLGSWFVQRRDVPAPARAAQLSLVPTRGGAFGSIAARY